jgi:hypothetical protein
MPKEIYKENIKKLDKEIKDIDRKIIKLEKENKDLEKENNRLTRKSAIKMQLKYIKNNSQIPLNLEILTTSMKKNYLKLTWLHSDFLVKIFQLLDMEKDYQDQEAAYLMKQLELYHGVNLNILSLKMSKTFFQLTKEKTLNTYLEQLPTLGIMHNGNLLIQTGFYHKTENEYILSDILEKKVHQKYYLSDSCYGRNIY